MELKFELLDSVELFHLAQLSFQECVDAHGRYETEKFTLRLSPVNHEYMAKIETGAFGQSLPDDAILAYSTYLHETIHWWQHCGSTSGLLLSLSYLGQSHANLEALRQVARDIGPIKSLKQFTDSILRKEGAAAQEKLSHANFAVNNALDVEYYKLYAFDPRKNAKILVEQQHFEAVGHAYFVVYGHLVGMLGAVLDPSFKTLPNPELWGAELLRLATKKVEGFYVGSPIRLPATGMHAIYEGQASFTQMQFLDGSLPVRLTISEWREKGRLTGIYGEAFDWYLKLTGNETPQYLDDPIVGLFLLICDIAINPTRGIPFAVESFEDFIIDVDIGVRFTNLCTAAKNIPYLASTIKNYSKAEYIKVSTELTTFCGYDHPMSALFEIKQWAEKLALGRELMEDHRTYDFQLSDLPIRFVVSHFLAFSQDRYTHPEFFCWPGMFLSKARAHIDEAHLWLKHLAPFADRGDKKGVYPRAWPNRDPAKVKTTFNNFFGAMAVYDLTRQWVLQKGPFRKDYRWLMENYDQSKVDQWASDSFFTVYGIRLEDFDFMDTP